MGNEEEMFFYSQASSGKEKSGAWQAVKSFALSLLDQWLLSTQKSNNGRSNDNNKVNR